MGAKAAGMEMESDLWVVRLRIDPYSRAQRSPCPVPRDWWDGGGVRLTVPGRRERVCVQEMLGVQIDASRGAVMTVERLKGYMVGERARSVCMFWFLQSVRSPTSTAPSPLMRTGWSCAQTMVALMGFNTVLLYMEVRGVAVRSVSTMDLCPWYR